MKKLTAYLTLSLCILRATTHTSWGLHCSTLKIALHALIRSKLDYVAPAWQPWLSTTNLSCLDCLQNRVYTLGSVVTGSQCPELQYMQQLGDPQTSREGIMKH